VTGEAVATEEYLPDQSNAAITNSVHRSMAIEPLWIINRIQDAELNQGGDGGLPPDAGFSNYPYTTMSSSPKPPPDDSTRTDRPYAWGFFDSLYPNSSGVCTATLNASDLVYPEIPAHMITMYPMQPGPGMMQPDQPQTQVRYEWKNVQVVLAGASVGQQMFADLTVTRDGCRAQYQVALLSPQTTCAGTTLDMNGNPLPDRSQCSPTAVPDVPNPTVAQLYGSGLPVGVSVDCKDMNAVPGPADAGTGAGAGPDWECVPTKTSP
jgi:hypothetical protein